MNTASIIFEFRGQRHEYNGRLPDMVMDALPDDLFDDDGFWRGGFPDTLEAQVADAEDTLPEARWEIEHVGGVIIEVLGARPNGAIHLEDWKDQVIY